MGGGGVGNTERGPGYPYVFYCSMYLELWVGLAASHGDVGLYPEPGGPVRVPQPNTLALHAAKIQVHTQGYLQACSAMIQ